MQTSQAVMWLRDTPAVGHELELCKLQGFDQKMGRDHLEDLVLDGSKI
jgi:hypothetical protein